METPNDRLDITSLLYSTNRDIAVPKLKLEVVVIRRFLIRDMALDRLRLAVIDFVAWNSLDTVGLRLRYVVSWIR